MDHVETPPDSPYAPLQIPCLSTEPYDDPDFLTYPERAGWDIDRLLAGDFSQHEDAASFLQNWLFFGVLWEAFGPIGRGAKHHYIQPQEGYPNGTITVASLDEQILQLTSFISATFQSDKAAAQTVGHRVETCLRTVSRFCRLATCEGDPRPGFKVWPLSPEIDLSIRALSQRLSWSFATSAMNLVFSSSTGGLEFSCAWLPLRRMQAAGWCISEVAMVEETFTSASAYYTSELKPPPSSEEKDHSECTRNLCMARQLNEETYRTAHCPTPHTTAECDCQHYGPHIEDVTAILESGGIPLLSITPTKKEPYIKVEVERYTEGKRYIAFSHVWSDGLGNPSANTLPQCQLQRIHGLLDDLVSGIRSIDLVNRLAFKELWKKKFHGPSLLFWMDTMCIPVAEEHRELRSKAIKSMKAVYERAFRVLVLDADIQSFPSSDYTQSFMRIRLSAWMRRLWTLNEGVLANKLCIKFADGFLDVQERAEAAQKESYESELTSIKGSFGTPSRDADNFHWKFRLLRINVISEPDPRLVKRTETSITSPGAKRCFAIMEAFSAALYRSTSKERDEMLCFASLIGWDTSLLKGLPFEDHMHALLSTESQLPQGMLFLAGPRMRQRGWRWAINRFGNCGAKRLNVKSDDMTPGLVTEDGFVVDYSALVLPAGYTREQLERATVSAELGNGIVGTFEIIRHDEGISNATAESESQSEDSDYDQLYVLFWDAIGTIAPRTPMPAAIVSGPSNEDLVKGEVVYRFECLAYLEVLEKGVGELEKDDGLAQLVRKKWTIG
ncbi:uncharacterized protein APUU_20802S [Aspergillus puulaauensis]|uniref:Heterokaryon incompatibility domain-containing protein n=1 Tax=Aspergillus puulaauensis TaxID=1220207 RepID=A0A7R7XFI6_9EURO|nr:uncharacterized protein APUU_20802S [Aspergillus puulaauensis]BCS20370.1 hypothetical protein APUU_20802S [Aspergillus puulaauensis]